MPTKQTLVALHFTHRKNAPWLIRTMLCCSPSTRNSLFSLAFSAELSFWTRTIVRSRDACDTRGRRNHWSFATPRRPHPPDLMTNTTCACFQPGGHHTKPILDFEFVKSILIPDQFATALSPPCRADSQHNLGQFSATWGQSVSPHKT